MKKELTHKKIMERNAKQNAENALFKTKLIRGLIAARDNIREDNLCIRFEPIDTGYDDDTFRDSMRDDFVLSTIIDLVKSVHADLIVNAAESFVMPEFE